MSNNSVNTGDRRARVLASRQRSIRRQLAATGLVAILGAVCLVASMKLDSAEPIAGATEGRSHLQTAVLSARRTPELLARPLADRRLRALVAPIVASSPAAHCIAVNPQGVSVVADNTSAALTPASNLKLVTGIVALDVLGSDTRFTTRVISDSEPLNGVVNGSLFLIGGGDPLLETDNYDKALKFTPQPHTRLEDLADAVKAAGVTSITGGVVGDDARLDNVRSIDSWPANYVNDGEVGPLSGLSVNDSRVIPGSDQLGRLEAASATEPANDPAGNAATVFSQLLTARGITVGAAPKSGSAPESGQQLASIDSLTVQEIVGQMLRFSDNNTAELLLKEIGMKAQRDPSTAAGITAETAALTKWGMPMDGVRLVDGSGLDPQNKVTCQLLIALLQRAGPQSAFANGLAVPRENGTLRDRFSESLAADNVRAKTGTLRAVTSMSGWVTSDSGAQIGFSYLQNFGEEGVVGNALQRQVELTEALTTYPQMPPVASLEPLPAVVDGVVQPTPASSTTMPSTTVVVSASPSTSPDAIDSAESDGSG